ncbi:hypothetical protein [Streptomyces sp. NPDC091217]
MGMRERARSVGGRTWAGRDPAEGFEVVVELQRPARTTPRRPMV